MLIHAYLKNGIVYVPTVVRLRTGAYRDIEPVAVVRVANTEELDRAFLDAIARRNAVVPPPPKDNWPPPVLLKYAGAKTWSAFARGTSVWKIEEEKGIYQIVGYRNHPDGYWVPDAEQKIDFPLGSRADDVIARMIATLQDAAKQQA